MSISSQSQSSPDLALSVIVPLYNEEESVRPLHAALVAALNGLGLEYEIVLVDDGSRDRTAEIVIGLTAADSRVRLVRFRRNYGQTPAMAAGIEYAHGRTLVTMDGDLQNDPADIPLFLQKIEEGYDIVVGWRHRRQDKLMTRRVPSRVANWLIGKVTGVPIRDNGCSLKAYRASVIKGVPLYSEMHRFIPAMASLAGVRIAEIKVRHHARRFGQSKYGLSRIYKVLLDLLTVKTLVSFSQRPMHWFGLLAAPAAVLSVLSLAAALWTMIGPGERGGVIAAGNAMLFGALSVFLLLSGAVAELVYKTGSNRIDRIAELTKHVVEPGDPAP